MMIRKIWNITLNFLVIAVLMCVLILAVGFFSGLRYYIVLSGSMEPAIHTGSLGIVNTKAEYEKMKQGDIVAYENALGTRITHRVEAVAAEGLITKGDANEISDGVTVNKENFIGETVGSIPFAGYLLMFLQSKKGIILSVAGIVALWLIDMIIQCLTAEKETKKERPSLMQRVRRYEN